MTVIIGNLEQPLDLNKSGVLILDFYVSQFVHNTRVSISGTRMQEVNYQLCS